MKVDKFVAAIIVVVVLAYFFPQFGVDPSIPLGTISSIGISLIFFFYGLKLSPEKLKSGLSNWKLHLLIQGSTFLLFPLILILIKPLFGGENGFLLWISFFFLAILPSTVSSSVVMVSMAKGNVPAAIFNASISGLIGIAITPLWMGLFLNVEGSDFDMSTIYSKLVVEILLPICFGLFLQRWFGFLALRYASGLALFDKSIILVIVYKSFCASFISNVFADMSMVTLMFISLGVVALFLSVYKFIWWLSKRLSFSEEDQITATFCGTKKSLVHGTVFSKVLLPAAIPAGYVLLPLMLFHAWQILLVSMIASKLSERK